MKNTTNPTEPTELTKCQCGAITVNIDGNDYSMLPKTFDELFPNQNSAEIEEKFFSCNYCTNHWGVDLCGCGSGELFQKCYNNLPECKRPAQSIENGIKSCYSDNGWG